MKIPTIKSKTPLLILITFWIVFGNQVSYAKTITASTRAPLTEVTLHESIVTLTLSGGTYERSRIKIGKATAISGIPGVTIGTFGPAWFGVERVSDTKITVELGFDGNIDADATLTITVGADAIKNYNGKPLTAKIHVTALAETITASTRAPLTEVTLHESIVTLTLSGGTYERSRIDIGEAMAISGIPGVTIGTFGPAWFGVERVSDTKITVELGFDGNIDADATLTITVGADAIKNYNGTPLSTKIRVPAVAETITASTRAPLTEVTLHESIVTLSLSGRTYERSRIKIGKSMAISGIPGVTTAKWSDVERVSDSKITVELGFDGDIDADATLTFTVGADAIENYNGPALTTQISVSASTKTSEQPRDVGNTEQPVAIEQSESPAEDSKQGSIEGPWLWMVVPTNPAEGDGISTEIDSLAEASGGTITEAYVAQNSVNEGDSIGQSRWTSGKIYQSEHRCRKYKVEREPNFLLKIFTLGFLTDECIDPTVCWEDNISTLAKAFGPRTGENTAARTAYALINLISPPEQSHAILKARSGDAIKVWLNGKVVYRKAADTHRCRKVDVLLACDPEVCVPDPTIGESNTRRIDVTLKPGNNLLFVKVRQHGEYWDMGIGLTGDFTTEIPKTETVRPTAKKMSTSKEDVNADGTVNTEDFILIALSLGKKGENPADINEDGVVDIQDLVLVAGVLDNAAAAPSLHSHSFGTFTATDVRAWLAQAEQFAMQDITSQKGILFLEQLLSALIPKETALLANYPNPFNPETWIPYQLAKPADVTLTIYAVNGHIVRQLVLGHQPAGSYRTRSSAAYWDGKNEFGETVASGVYFYTITAGDFTATRKMLIRK